MIKEIICFTDGSGGALGAAGLAIKLAEFYQAGLNAFYIIDSGWGSLLGDEWINTSETRMRFFRWFEGELKDEAAKSLKAVEEMARERGVPIKIQILIGPTEKVILNQAGEKPGALVVLPNPAATAPAAAGGLRYNAGSLIKKLNGPVLIGPK
jgi:nucleotide-binding universal stress UspA family protein